MKTSHAAVALLVCASYLSGCGEQAVLDCAKPTSIASTTGLKIGGDVSVKTAQGAISASLGKDLKADFAAADPNTWIAIATTYQYQTCQVLNSTSCSDLPKSACLQKKKEILNEAFDKINLQLKEERERQGAEKARQAAAKIDACVATKVAEYEVEKKHKVEGGATAKSPGSGGGKNTGTAQICHSVGPNQRVVSAATTKTSCHGGRCSVTAPVISDEQRKVCVTATAWSESKSFGGGGSGQYRLDVVYKDVATTEVVGQFRALCTAAK
jgi:hypothetical protein